MSFLDSKMAQEDNDTSSEYYGCGGPCNARGQDISGLDISLITRNIPVSEKEGLAELNKTREKWYTNRNDNSNTNTIDVDQR